MRKSKVISLCLAGFTVLLLSGCQSAADTETASPATAVEVTAAARGTIQTEYVYTGQVKPARQVSVISKVAGKVNSVNVEVGDIVAEDDILCVLDERDIQNSVDVLEAQLKSADAAVTAALTNLDNVDGAAMQAQIDAAKAAMDRAEITLSDAETAYHNAQALFEVGAVSQSELTQAESGYRQAQLAYDQAAESYRLLSTDTIAENRALAQSALLQAQAARDAVQVQLDNAMDTLADTSVRAPMAGVVTARSIEVGAMLSQTVPPFTIMELSTVTVNVNVTEQSLHALSEGGQVQVMIGALGSTLTGTISLVSPAADELKNTYLIRITLDNSAGAIRPGMLAEVHFLNLEHKNALVLPRGAVLGAGEESHVFVVRDGAAEKVFVGTGIDNGMEIEVTEGVSAGDWVVTKGQSFLDDGMPVAVVNGEVA